MKSNADKHRSFREFAVGDIVYLKLQPYMQSSVAPRENHKLSFKFYGPYPIIEKINIVTYKLQLPAHASAHPIFHVSQLRRALLPGTVITPDLPICTDMLAIPVEILQTHWRQKNGAMVEQVKVRWSPDSAKEDTWEDRAALFDRFPQTAAWDQAATQGERGGM